MIEKSVPARRDCSTVWPPFYLKHILPNYFFGIESDVSQFLFFSNCMNYLFRCFIEKLTIMKKILKMAACKAEKQS